MRFGVINTVAKSATLQEHKTLWDAGEIVGLRTGNVDFGSITPTMQIVVYEYGLFTPKEEQCYFAINGRLYGGNAIIFGCNELGETVDLNYVPSITWFKNAHAVELAIQRGEVNRPEIKVNGKSIWQWPKKADAILRRQPNPDGEK